MTTILAEPSACVDIRQTTWPKATLPALILPAIFTILYKSGWYHLSKHDASAFSTYHDAALAMSEGRNPYGQFNSYPYIYPPFFAWACQPLVHLPYWIATRIMLLLDCLTLMTAILVGASAVVRRLARRSNAAITAWVALTAALVAIGPIFRELRSEQANCFLLLGFALALYWLDRRPFLAGMALAVAISIKYLPLIAIPYLLVRRRWTAAITALGGSALIPLLPATTLGWSANLRYLATAYGGLARALGAAPVGDAAHSHPLSDPLNISVSSSLSRLVHSFGWPNWSATVLILAVFALWFTGWMLLYRSYGQRVFLWPAEREQNKSENYRSLIAIEWAGLMVAAIAFSPNGEMTLASLPMALFAALWFAATSRSTRICLCCIAITAGTTLLLPVAAMGHAGSARWNAAGGASWILLMLQLSVLAIALRQLHGEYNVRQNHACIDR